MNTSTTTPDFDLEEKTWHIIDKCFENENRLVEHHIDSFNHLILEDLPKIIKEDDFQIKIYSKWSDILKKHTQIYCVNFENFYISNPMIDENNGTSKRMFPNDARLRNMTYESPFYIDITHKYIEINEKTGKEEVTNYKPLNKELCGAIPIMIRSKFCVLSEENNKTRSEMGECEYDKGGYFIVKGGEKVIISQERKCENKIYCFEQKNSQSKYSHESEILSINSENNYTLLTKVRLTSKEGKIGKTIKVSIRSIQIDIPLFILFRALGVIDDKSIISYIVGNIDTTQSSILDMLKGSIEEGCAIQTQELAILYISKHMTGVRTDAMQKNNNIIKYTLRKLKSMLLPHLGDNLKKKAYFVGYMTNKLLKTYFGVLRYDDRDSFLNKKVETSGELLSQLFRLNFSNFINDIKTNLEKDVRAGRIKECGNNLSKKIKPNDIKTKINYALLTGNWGSGSNNYHKMKKGVAQLLPRLTYLGTLSTLRRVVAPIDRKGKQPEPRKLHTTQWGKLCPFETPEGGAVGIVKNIALMAHITIPSNPQIIYSCLEEYGVINLENISPLDMNNSVKIIINGNWFAQTFKPSKLVAYLKKMRGNGLINIYTSIAWRIQFNEISIRTDGGRFCRPLYRIKNNKLLFNKRIFDKIQTKTWNQVLRLNIEINDENCESCEDVCTKAKKISDSEYDECIIEYIDTDEEDTCMIAMSQDNIIENNKNKKENGTYYNYTHCEIHPSLKYGALATNIPFLNHNQAPRNLYYSSMGKQALGVYSTAFNNRMDTASHVLHYPQKPLCTTKTSKYVHSDILSSGANCIVAIACYTGYNQEDSLIFNKSSIDRGLMSSNYYRTYKDEEKKNQSTLEDEKFIKPTKFNPDGTALTEKMGRGSYDKLDENGFIKEGTYVSGNDYIIGKAIPLKNVKENECKYRDSSTSLRNNESGVVDKVYVGRNTDGYRFCKVRVRSERIPEIGDKFCSKHGQKGTIGMTYLQEDMPFTKDGVYPDIIMNPNALPKRMTVGHLIECAFSKMSALMGVEFDATPYRKTDIRSAGVILKDLGFNSKGTEILYNGKTGEQIKSEIFIGPTFYNRLKHLVKDKIHSRANGPSQLLSRQPAEGRARDGGLRFGEMERDCMISHGTVQFLKERTFDCSDKFFVWVDKETGMISPVNPYKGIYKSLYSNNKTRFAKVNIPYATKLFFHELQSMHIVPKIKTSIV